MCFNIHSSNHGPCDQGLDSSDESEDDGCDPDQLPVPPLDHHRVHGGDEMDADDVDQRPQQNEAENRRRIVEVDCLRAADRERPVERWELGWFVWNGSWVDHGLEEIVGSAGILLLTSLLPPWNLQSSCEFTSSSFFLAISSLLCKRKRP